MSNIKQVIILRRDLNMRLGKSVAQGAHASMAAVLRDSDCEASKNPANGEVTYYKVIPYSPELEFWFEHNFTKICVGCDSEEELLELDQKAQEAGLMRALITDIGRTEFHGEATITALAIGPANAEDIDKITGHLKLL